YLVDRCGRAEAEMQSPIGMGKVTVSSVNFIDLRQASGFEFDSRSGGIAIRFRSLQFQTYPMASFRSAVVAEQHWRAVEFIYDHIDVSILVVISESRAARHPAPGESGN